MTVQRRSGDLEGRARRFYTDVLSQLIGRLQEFVPSSRLIPQQPRNFSLHVDDQVCLPELILEPCVSPLQLAYLLIQRISLRLAAAFLRQGLQRPAMRPPCATSSGATSTGPLAAGVDPPRRARCTGPLLRRSAGLYDELNRRRSGLSTTSGSAGTAALRLASPVPGALPFSSILSRSPNMFVFSAFALL